MVYWWHAPKRTVSRAGGRRRGTLSRSRRGSRRGAPSNRWRGAAAGGARQQGERWHRRGHLCSGTHATAAQRCAAWMGAILRRTLTRASSIRAASAERRRTMYHPFVDDQVYRIEHQFRERQAAMARMARQLDAGRSGIWAQLGMRFQQVWARAAILLVRSPFPPPPRPAIRGSMRHKIEASPDGQSCPQAYDRGS
jgi:hypothetical protein